MKITFWPLSHRTFIDSALAPFSVTADSSEFMLKLIELHFNLSKCPLATAEKNPGSTSSPGWEITALELSIGVNVSVNC